MTWLSAGCSEPRAPVAECVLSVCCCVLLCVECVSVWSWSALQDLKIAPSVHPLFVLYCIVYYMYRTYCKKARHHVNGHVFDVWLNLGLIRSLAKWLVVGADSYGARTSQSVKGKCCSHGHLAGA